MRFIGPVVVIAGAIVTLPSMLGASEAVVLSIGRWWTVAVAVAGVIMLAFPRRGRIVGSIAAVLVLYAVVMTMWCYSVSNQHQIPAGDLPYLIGLPVITGIGAILTIVMLWRRR